MGNDNNNSKDTEIQPHETSLDSSNTNNTAHPPSDEHQAVTSNNPTSESIQQPSYQQLHEAMLAAVNSHGVASLSPHGLVAAAAAAMAAAAAGAASSSNASTISPTANTSITQSETPTPPVHHSKHKPLHELDVTKRESIRAANRERKKKWRIHNEERNKDNDLRCRVNKRATKLYGTADTPEKRAWAQEEFEKRRQKRMEKERRKNAIDNVLSVPGSPHIDKNQDLSLSEAVLNGVTDQLGYYNMQQQQQQQQQQQTAPLVDPAAAAKMLDFPPELQRQLLEQLNNMIAMTNNGGKLPSSSTSNDASNQSQQQQQQPEQQQEEDQVAPNNPESTQEEQGLSSSTSASNSAHNSPLQDKSEEMKEEKEDQQQQQQDDKKPEYPMDAVLTLMQLNAGWRE